MRAGGGGVKTYLWLRSLARLTLSLKKSAASWEHFFWLLFALEPNLSGLRSGATSNSPLPPLEPG